MGRAKGSPWKRRPDQPVEGDCPHADLQAWGALPRGVGHCFLDIACSSVRASSIIQAWHRVSQRLEPGQQPQFLNHRDEHYASLFRMCHVGAHSDKGRGTSPAKPCAHRHMCLPSGNDFPNSWKGAVGASCGPPLSNPLFGSLHLFIP